MKARRENIRFADSPNHRIGKLSIKLNPHHPSARAMVTNLNPRVETEIREAIDEISQGEWTIGETAAKLLRIGVVVRESGKEPKIEGPFGIPRPFANIKLSDRMTVIRTEIDEELTERMQAEFDDKPNTAARRAIRLGVITVAGEKITIRGPKGAVRPFARISLSGYEDEAVVSSYEELRERIA